MIISNTEPVGTGAHGAKPLSPDQAPEKTIIIGGGVRRGAFLTPEQAVGRFSGETAEMIFPQDVNLTTQAREIIHYPAGRHAVPEELADHPYLKANGASRLIAPPVRELQSTLEGKEQKTAPLAK
jgi:hypothetical protein